MTHIRPRHSIFSAGRLVVAGLALMALPLLAACATATIEEAVPVAATEPAPAEPVVAVAPADGAVTDDSAVSALLGEPQRDGHDTGTFPNLNVPPAVAAPQLSAADKRARLDELAAARRQQATEAASARPSASPAELRRLQRQHEKVLQEIEAE
jgi:hypothetical protein